MIKIINENVEELEKLANQGPTVEKVKMSEIKAEQNDSAADDLMAALEAFVNLSPEERKYVIKKRCKVLQEKKKIYTFAPQMRK